MNWLEFDGKKVALLGAGIENMALIPFLKKTGAEITLCDRLATETTEKLKGDGIKVVTGDSYLSDLDRFDYVFRIAGLPIASLEEALKNTVERPIVTSPTDLFIALKPCHIIGVTGTKGKGTTSTMIGSILEASGKEVAVVGNIGKPIFDLMEGISPEMYVVIELSSFQLEDIKHSPQYAVILPIGEDHLQPLSETNPNYHRSVEVYVAAKSNITAFQNSTDVLVYAADSPSAKKIALKSAARRIGVGQNEADLVISPNGEINSEGKIIFDLNNLGLKGNHIFLNASIAVALCREIGCEKQSIEQGLKNFKPLPHRLETISNVEGIKWVDDSYATTPDATIAALSAFKEPIILILGGSRKGADFRELAVAVATSQVKAVVLLGEEAERIEESLDQYAPNIKVIRRASSMLDVVNLAKEFANKGDVVLLSPACASKDMFKDAADRGNEFKQVILNVTADH